RKRRAKRPQTARFFAPLLGGQSAARQYGGYPCGEMFPKNGCYARRSSVKGVIKPLLAALPPRPVQSLPPLPPVPLHPAERGNPAGDSPYLRGGRCHGDSPVLPEMRLELQPAR